MTVTVCIIAAAIAAGCWTRLPYVGTEGPLRVGITPTNPPIIFLKEGQPAGVEADFAAEVGRLLNRPVQFERVTENDMYSALLVNQVDILMSGLAMPAKPPPGVVFCAPYSAVGQRVWAMRPVNKWMVLDIQRQLAVWQADGTINRILAKWNLPPSPPPAPPAPPAPKTNAAPASAGSKKHR